MLTLLFLATLRQQHLAIDPPTYSHGGVNYFRTLKNKITGFLLVGSFTATANKYPVNHG